MNDSSVPGAPGRFPRPDPEQGWSRSVLRLTGAVVDPADGGVWDRGALCPEAMLYRWRNTYKGHRGTAAPQDPAPMAGRHLWGGTLFFHFGHFLAESLSRLWAAEGSGAASILFTPKHLRGKRPAELAGYQSEILKRLGIAIPVRILYEPVVVDELIIPGQGFGLGALSRGTPEFRAFARRMDPGPGPEAESRTGTGKLYVSRSALPPKTGSILGERDLERMLAREGFTIYHPQQHSIEHQLRSFRNATHILGPDGSAFHLAAFVAQPHQGFTIIKRRSAREYVTFLDQLDGLGADVAAIDAVTADWVRPGKGKPDDMSWGELDFARLSEGLLKRGLIAAPLPLPAPFTEELDRIGRFNRGPMLSLPVGKAS